MICAALALGLHLGTLHFTEPTKRNWFNPGVYAVCDDYAAGTYYNSQFRESVYVGKVWHIGHIDLVTGAVTGYAGMRVAPFIVPSIKVAEHLRLSILPPVKLSGWGGVHASWEF